MKLTHFALSAAAVFAAIASASAVPLEVRAERGVGPALIPEFGVEPGRNRQDGFCEGAPDEDGNVASIPCSCPPDRATFIDALNADVAANRVEFPTDDSPKPQLARLTAALTTLQNLPEGCPLESTTFAAQADALEAQLSDSTTGAVAVAARAPSPWLGLNHLPPGLQHSRPPPKTTIPTKKPVAPREPGLGPVRLPPGLVIGRPGKGRGSKGRPFRMPAKPHGK
ncbi:hypothetical protein C8Q77DRAFT_1072097 [Trametes polyzona]|nr:hypothetical protein C8Q77DRAFT_1072097 [Trametes polyzona]